MYKFPINSDPIDVFMSILPTTIQFLFQPVHVMHIITFPYFTYKSIGYSLRTIKFPYFVTLNESIPKRVCARARACACVCVILITRWPGLFTKLMISTNRLDLHITKPVYKYFDGLEPLKSSYPK